MKKILTFGLVMMITLTISAQKIVTQFLGIPVDGTKSEMIQKLKAKGYIYNASHDYMEGEFNGRDVRILIATTNNKVSRIVVTDVYSTRSEADIRIRFNNLCKQFAKSSKYMAADVTREYEINVNEDISYNITVKNKRYDAAYFQINDAGKDTTGLFEWTVDKINSKYTKSEREKLTNDEISQLLIDLSTDFLLEKVSKRLVWFKIDYEYGEYTIDMYYDNEYNRSNGEDL